MNKRKAVIGYLTYEIGKRVVARAMKKKTKQVAAQMTQRSGRSRGRWFMAVPLIGGLIAGAAFVMAKLRGRSVDEPPAE